MKVSCVVTILALAGTVAAAPQRKRILKLHKSNVAAAVERGLQPGSGPQVATPATTDEDPGTIVDIAASNEDFTTVVAAVTAAGLVDTLAGEGPFTVFAPTNDAFGSLPEGTVDTLLLPENIDQLADILKYHVVSGSVPSSSLKSGEVTTLNGDSITVDVSDAMGIMLNDVAHVITADIMASNGVIHVIDKVLLPPNAATHSHSHSMSLSISMMATEPPNGGAAVKETPVPSSPAPSTPAPSTAPPVEGTNAPKGGNKPDDTYSPSPAGSMSMSMTSGSTIPTFVDGPLTATPTNPGEPSGTSDGSAMMIGTCLAGVAIMATAMVTL